MLKMNRHFNSAGTSYLVCGVAPSRNMLTLFGNASLRGGGFGKLAAAPSGYGAPNSGLACAVKSGDMSAYVSCNGGGAAMASGAEGRGVSGEAGGTSTADAQGIALSWGAGTAGGYSTVSSAIVGLAFVDGSAEGLSETTGLLFAPVDIGEMIGLAEGLCEAYGAMSALLNMAGESSGVGEADAVVTGIFEIDGASAGTSEATSSHLDSYGWMVGQAGGGSSVSVNPYADGFMSGTTASGELGLSPADINAVADASAERVWGYER